MPRLIKRLFFLISNFGFTKSLLGLINEYNFLYEIGWVQSKLTHAPIAKDGLPIPWVTYPYIYFIQDRLSSNFILFEFGSGNSTFFYSKYVKLIDTVENDKEWFDKVNTQFSTNVNPFFQSVEKGGEYSKMATTTRRKYHMVIVDGRDRVNCVINSFPTLTEDGILVLDDSEREEYKEGISFMVEKGFKKIDFWGLAPCVDYHKCTTIFYRTNNCLNI